MWCGGTNILQYTINIDKTYYQEGLNKRYLGLLDSKICKTYKLVYALYRIFSVPLQTD